MTNRLCIPLALFLSTAVPFALGLQAQQTDKPSQPVASTAPAATTNVATAAASPIASSPSPLAEALQLYRTGKFDAAIERYNSVIKTNTDATVAIAYAGLARVYLRQKKPADAYTAAAKAVELAPSVATGHSALGEVYFRQGKLAEAQTELLTPLWPKRKIC